MFENTDELVTTSEEKSRDRVRRKEKSIMKTWEEPVLPKLCKIVFWGMQIIIAAMLLVDINAFIRYDSYLGILHLYRNICMTGFLGWIIYSILILPLCVITMKQTEKKFWKQKQESGIEEKTEEDRARNRRALTRLNRNYLQYIKINIVGLCIWLLLYLINIIFS